MDMYDKQTTAGSLLEQSANAEFGIVSARRSCGRGFEATSIGGRTLKVWTGVDEATYAIMIRAIEEALDPGTPDQIEEATEFVGHRALVTREAIRQSKVLPLRQETIDAIRKSVATGVARITAKNAEAVCDAIVRSTYGVVEHLHVRLDNGIGRTLSPRPTTERLEAAVAEAPGKLATVAIVMRRLQGRAATESARIDQDLPKSERALQQAEEHLRLIAHETSNTRIFGVERAVQEVIREVSVTIPKLTDERLSQLYLQKVRERMLDVQNVLSACADRLEQRIDIIRNVRDKVHEACDEGRHKLHDSRVQVIGAHIDEALRRAAVSEIVGAVYDGIAHELRDVITWKVPQDRIFTEMLKLVRDRVEKHAPWRSIDTALLDQKNAAEVATHLDHMIRDLEVPVALQRGVDRARLRDWRCRVIRVPPGSSSAQALIDHCGYRPDAFDWTGAADRIDILVTQSGISLRDTRVFAGDEMAYREESADPAAPPVSTLSDACLHSLVGDRALAARRSNGSRRRSQHSSERTDGSVGQLP